MKVIFIANARIPSEKAHPYQIIQMCEAFADAGADAVTLLYADRKNPIKIEAQALWSYYGVSRNFEVETLSCIDRFPSAARFTGKKRQQKEQIAAALQIISFNLSLILRIRKEKDTLIYSRDAISLFVLSLLWPRRIKRAIYEAHTYTTSQMGSWLRKQLSQRVGGFVVITDHLRQRYAAMSPAPRRMLVAHDGIKRERFDISGDRETWRKRFGWPEDATIIGYSGRFYGGLEKMDKGLGTLLEATMQLARKIDQPVHLALVGGPAERVVELRAQAKSGGMPDDFILYPGQVLPTEVPGYLRAFDVCTIPSPRTDFFAYYTSPMKLFEYMASGTVLVASDLPSIAEVIDDEENGLLVEAENPDALAEAFLRLHTDSDIAVKITDAARRDVMAYTWETRARQILGFARTVELGNTR